jgi:hypothetical protein
MDLMQLIQFLMKAQDYGDAGGTEENSRWMPGQNRRMIIPELGPGERNYNQTPGNPQVALEDGWLRSLIPYETGEGGPPGRYNGDHQTRTLEQMMNNSPRYSEYMNTYNRNSADFRRSGGRWDPKELDLRQRETLVNRLTDYLNKRRQPL